jgi:hypothetical protein
MLKQLYRAAFQFPMTSNAIDHLYEMVSDSKAGDVSVCYFSSHGGIFTLEYPYTKLLNYIEFIETAEDTILKLKTNEAVLISLMLVTIHVLYNCLLLLACVKIMSSSQKF